MNHSQHTNYQTSFQIVRKDDQSYFAAIRAIFDWLCTKEREKALADGWKEFSYKGNWEHCYRSNARIQTATCIEDESKRAWALEYIHVDRELGPKRFWHTNVGIRDTGETLLISARVAYSWNNEDLDTEAPAPSPSVPYFIRQLLDKFTAFSGRKEFRLIENPLILDKSGSGTLIRDFVFSPERRYPLIVFNGNAVTQLKEAKRLAKELAGKAQVVLIASHPALGKELNDTFPRDFHIHFGRMRVFFPMCSGPNTSKRHRWFDVTTEDYESQREGIVHGLLRNHNLIERDSVTSVAEIHRMISKSRILKLKEATSGVSEEEIQALYQDYINEVECERDSAKKEAEQYAQQVDQLESDLQAAEWKNKALTGSTSPKSADTNVASMLFKLPDTLQEVVRIASELHSEKLIFAKEAFDSADENSACELVSDTWHIISHLASTLYDLKFNTENPGDLGKRFQEESGFEYARTEGKLTKANSSLSRQRRIIHDGKTYEIWPHIKKGNDGNKMIRVHFDYDNEKKKIVIGYVGMHMDNASTRKLK